MPVAGLFRRFVEGLIVGRRNSRPAQLLRRGAELVNRAYDNVGADFSENGERALIERLSPARFRVAFDVGANIGDWAEMAARCWPDVRVHAFEVAPATFGRLETVVAHSPSAGRILPHMIGLSDRDGTQDLYFYSEQPEVTCDRPRHHGPVERFTGVVRRGDGYLRETGVTQIDFLKIDVEGMEPAVLNGFSHALASGAIRCVQFEYGAFSIDTRFLLKDFFDLLGTDYVIGKVLQRGVDFKAYDWTMEDFRFANFVAIRRDEPSVVELARGVM